MTATDVVWKQKYVLCWQREETTYSMCLLLKIETQDGAISFAAAHPSIRPWRRLVRHLF